MFLFDNNFWIDFVHFLLILLGFVTFLYLLSDRKGSCCSTVNFIWHNSFLLYRLIFWAKLNHFLEKGYTPKAMGKSMTVREQRIESPLTNTHNNTCIP